MKRARLGGVEFTVLESESISETAEVTEYPVESGRDVSDHVKQKSSDLSLTGLMVGSDHVAQYRQLQRFKEAGRPIGYMGRERFSNMVITSLQRNYDSSNKTGFAFDISLKQVRIVKAKVVKIRVSAPRKKSRARTLMASNEYIEVESESGERVHTKIKEVSNNGKQQARSKAVSKVPSGMYKSLQSYKVVEQ